MFTLFVQRVRFQISFILFCKFFGMTVNMLKHLTWWTKFIRHSKKLRQYRRLEYTLLNAVGESKSTTRLFGTVYLCIKKYRCAEPMPSRKRNQKKFWVRIQRHLSRLFFIISPFFDYRLVEHRLLLKWLLNLGHDCRCQSFWPGSLAHHFLAICCQHNRNGKQHISYLNISTISLAICRLYSLKEKEGKNIRQT